MALNAAISPDEYEAAFFFYKNLDLELKFVKTKKSMCIYFVCFVKFRFTHVVPNFRLVLIKTLCYLEQIRSLKNTLQYASAFFFT